MRFRISLLPALLTLFLGATDGLAQQPPDGGGGGFPGGRRGGFGGGRGGDPNQFFDRLAGGKDVIRRADLQDPWTQRMFDGMAVRMNITSGEITREQFVNGMQGFQRGQRGGPGGPGGGEGGPPQRGDRRRGGPGGGDPNGGENQDRASQWAEAMFRRLDQNGDGVLNNDEMPEALQAERDKWDADHNGLIDLNEFKAYFQARMQQNMIDRGGQGGYGDPGGWGDPNQQAPAAPHEEEKRPVPVVHRAGKLPKEVPAWFQQLDTDQDAQVGLYEWRAAGRPIEEFLKMDRNGDGFLTVEEVLHYQKQNGQVAATAVAGGPPGPRRGGGPPDATYGASNQPGDGNPPPADAGRGGRGNGGPGGGRDRGQGGGRNRGAGVAGGWQRPGG